MNIAMRAEAAIAMVLAEYDESRLWPEEIRSLKAALAVVQRLSK